MKNLYFILFLIIFCNCDHENNKSLNSQKIDSAKNVIDSSVKEESLQSNNKENSKEVQKEKIEFYFLSDCDSLQMWEGGIQGLKSSSDSTCCYIMAQCFSNLHYDLIVFSNEDLDLKTATNFKEKKVHNNINGAEYYAFEIPKTTPENPENKFDTYDYVYPSEVKVYKRFEDGWYLIKKQQVENFEQLGKLKLNSIFKK